MSIDGMRNPKFEMGDLLQDKVTGFRGTVMVIAWYATGCLHYGMCPQEFGRGSNGNFEDPEWIWYDESRLEILEKYHVDFDMYGEGASGPCQIGPQI